MRDQDEGHSWARMEALSKRGVTGPRGQIESLRNALPLQRLTGDHLSPCPYCSKLATRKVQNFCDIESPVTG